MPNREDVVSWIDSIEKSAVSRFRDEYNADNSFIRDRARETSGQRTIREVINRVDDLREFVHDLTAGNSKTGNIS